MIPKRIAAKIFATDSGTDVDFNAFIALFHEFIREKVLEGLLLDVADYAHVPEGPGVVLIGHDVDYGIDQTGGRTGLLTVKKRIEGGSLGGLLDDTVRMGLLAAKAVEDHASTGVTFSADTLQLQLPDRLVAQNSSAGFESFRPKLEGLAARLFGNGARVERVDADEPRRPLAANVSATGSEDLATLLARLER